MTIYKIDPIADSRWPEFVERHAGASIFHTRGWLQALRATYSYEPVAFTTTKPGSELSDAIVFSFVKSWLTGTRLVSLPFSDHCEPLAEGESLLGILGYLQNSRSLGCKYVEMRPLTEGKSWDLDGSFGRSAKFRFHRIDLQPSLESIYKKFHDSCIRRKIKRAEREQLTYAAGRSEKLLRQFHHLLMLTRRRHKLPPQPLSWFRNLAEFLGDRLTIHLVSKSAKPVASIITLFNGRSVIYKYGCSDASFHALGGMPWLFWTVIQESKGIGACELDLGRSAEEDPGLIAFKEHLGGIPSDLWYYRSPSPASAEHSSRSRASISSIARAALAQMPDEVFGTAGKFLYRHLG